MTDPTRFPYSVTLRLPRQMEYDLENIAYDHRLSRAGFIRRTLAKAMQAESHQNVIAISKTEDLGGAI